MKSKLKEKVEKILKSKYDFGKVCQFCGFKPTSYLTPTGKRRGVIRHIQAMHIIKMPKKSGQILSLLKSEILKGKVLKDKPMLKETKYNEDWWLDENDCRMKENKLKSEVRDYIKSIN